MKLILYYFEYLSGLKINLFIYGAEQEDKERWTNMLNCRLAELPIKYLGIPISKHRLGLRAFDSLTMKMSNRLDP